MAPLVVATALPIDPLVHDFTFRHVVSHEVRLLANGVTQLGTGWAAGGLLGALAVVGRRTGDAALVRASLGGLGGVALGSVAGQAVKQLACRGRPGLVDGWGVDAVGPAGQPIPGAADVPGFFHWPCFGDSRYHSFPSGHAAIAFAVAAALARAVPARRRVWLVVATAVAASRVLLNAHFLSDVLGGALLGWAATAGILRLAARAGRRRPRAALGATPPAPAVASIRDEAGGQPGPVSA
jgi:membrane-associated phospholipid phosphatase